MGQSKRQLLFLGQVTMSTLVDGYVRAERMEEAESLLKIMKQKRIRGNVILYNTLLRGYSKEGDMTVRPGT